MLKHKELTSLSRNHICIEILSLVLTFVPIHQCLVACFFFSVGGSDVKGVKY